MIGWGRNLPLWFALRYLFSRTNAYAALINWVSMIGLALGVMILTVVASVMNGFDLELRTRLLSVVPHGFIDSRDATREQVEAIAELEGVAAVDRFFRGEAMIARRGAVNPVQLYGVDLASASFMDGRVMAGSLERLADDAAIVLGAPLARLMGLGIGDPVILLLSVPTSGGVKPEIHRFELVGTFEVGAEPDFGLAVVSVGEIERRSLDRSGQMGWRVTLADPLRPDLLERFAKVPVDTWASQFGELFRAVKIEKAIMFVLLALVVAIAAFNIVSGQAMLVNDKRGDVAMLTTLGATRRMVVRIFLVQGLAISIAGIATGLVIGVAIAANAGAVVATIESMIGASMIEGTYFTTVPSDVRISDLAAIAVLSLALCFAAVVRPAVLAARENPAEALHAP